jgi:uncharacterized protein YndB with AHSA1/START domain
VTQSDTQTNQEQELVIERVFDAPPEQVWRAWTEPEHIKQWWGPKDFTAPSIESDFREGGSYLWAMKSPDGTTYWSTGTFHEIVAPERLVVTDSFADEQGNVVPPSHYGMEGDHPMEGRVTVTFEELDGDRTKLTLRYAGMAPSETRDLAETGWNETLDKLAAHLG